MAYTATGARLTPDQCAQLVALSRRLDLTTGPGGARITPYWGAEVASIVGDLFGPWRPTSSMGQHNEASFIVLSPSRQIGAHRDQPSDLRRCHIPLESNAGCWSFHGGTWQQLEIGCVYTMDQAVEHGAVNWGPTPRLHLIIDQEVIP